MVAVRRPFSGEPDVDAVVELRLAIEAHRPSGFPRSRDQLRNGYLRPRPGWSREVCLWEQHGELVAVGETIISDAHSDKPVAYLRPRVHPRFQETSLLGGVLAWAEAVANEKIGRPFQTEVTAFRNDSARIELFERRGYELDRVFQIMTFKLDGRELPVSPVDGYRLRQFRGAEEVDAWIELYANSFQDHYDFHPVTREDRLSWSEEESYLLKLDLVLEAENGDLSAFCMTLRPVDDAGAVDWHIDLVGTHREHRRRGLAGWLLRYSLAQVREHGANEVSLGVDATSPTGANLLYERLGFVVTKESIDYRKSFS